MIVWAYWLARIFVGDIDEAILTAVFPNLLSLLEYRFLAYIGILVAFAIAWPRGRGFATFIIFFPIVVASTVAYQLFRRRSWALLLGLLQATTSLFGDLRWNVITKGLAVIATVTILQSHRPDLIAISALYLAALMFISLLRRVRRLVDSPSFVRVQSRAIRSAMGSSALNAWLTLGNEYSRHDLRGYSQTQATQVELTISNAIALNKFLYLWASQLDRYRRRYTPAVFFHVLTYAWVYVAAIVGFSLLNFALLKADPSQFATVGPRTFLAVLVYGLSTFALGAAGGMTPVGDLAYVLQFTAGIANLIILAGFATNVALSLLRERDDTATAQLIEELRLAADDQERRFRGSYAVSIDEAYRRLRNFGAATTSLVSLVVRALPREVADDQ